MSECGLCVTLVTGILELGHFTSVHLFTATLLYANPSGIVVPANREKEETRSPSET